jgi:hypothetical protein
MMLPQNWQVLSVSDRIIQLLARPSILWGWNCARKQTASLKSGTQSTAAARDKEQPDWLINGSELHSGLFPANRAA